jgi:hypothetical protein
MTPIIIFLLISLSILVLYTIFNRPKTESEDTFVPAPKVKKLKPTKPVSSGVSSGPAKPLGKIEEPALKKETASVVKTDAKAKSKKAAAKKTKKPKDNGDQLLHS